MGSEIPWVGDFSRPVRVAAAVDVERGRAAGPRRSYWLGELTATGNVAVGQWSAWASAAGTGGLYGP